MLYYKALNVILRTILVLAVGINILTTAFDVQSQNPHTSYITSLSWSPAGDLIATGSADNTINVWNVSTQQILYTLQGHTAEVSSVDWSPDGQYIASSSFDGTVRIWNAANGQIETIIPNEFSNIAVFSVAWNSDGTKIATGDSGHSVNIYEPFTGTLLTKFLGHVSEVLAVDWGSSNHFLASAGWDGNLIIWDLNTMEEVVRLSEANLDIAYSVDWQPSGNLVAEGGNNGYIYMEYTFWYS